jgi:hypothetical protein
MKEPAQKTPGSGTRQRTVAGLILNEREITCPHCHISLIVGSPINPILTIQGKCPNSEKDFLIAPMTSAEYADQREAA